MSKPIICVYQDCILCGDRGKKIKKLVFEKNLNIRKVSFASQEGSYLVHKALTEHKIGRMPFFTDGVNFTTNLEDLIEKPKTKGKGKKK